MLSLPTVPTQYSDYTPFLSTPWRPRGHSPPPAFGGQQQQQQHHNQRQQRQQREDEKLANSRSPLALLAADEAAIAQRKSAVRNFGSYWIRPPGVPKTLQAQTEEEAERAEQEELARQERGMLDLQAQQQLEETRQRAAEAAAETEAGEGEEEHDLDDEIPEAEEADGSNIDISGTGGTTIHSESLLEGSSQIEQRDIENENEMEEAELTGIARDEEDLGMERDLDMEQDLDNSVPEAGNYEHTDTEAEDTESDSELHDSFAYQSARRSARHTERSQASVPSSAFRAPPQSEFRASRLHDRFLAQEDLPRSPGSFHLSSSILESSFVGSSPVMQRTNQSARGRRDGRRRDRLS